MLVPYVVPTTMCCTRNCCLDVSADRVNAIRKELWTSDYEKEVIMGKDATFAKYTMCLNPSTSVLNLLVMVGVV